MRRFHAIAAVMAAFLLAAPASANQLQDEVLSHTVQLNGNCSGTLIYSNRDKKTGDVETVILTAKHCVANADKQDMFVDFPVYQKNRVVKKDRYIARVKAQSYKADLALVVLKDKQTYFDKVSKLGGDDVDIAMGDQVVTVGYPLGNALTVTSGLFGSLETIDYPSDGVEYYRATPDIVGGNSGGAMYHKTATGAYELIGVTTAGHRMFTFFGLYTPAADIYEFLKVSLPAAVGLGAGDAKTGGPK